MNSRSLVQLIFASLLIVTMLSACVSAPQSVALRQQTAADLPVSVLLPAIPFFSQSDFQCGPAALATVLVASVVEVTPEQLVPLVYVPARKGSFQVEMLAATRSHGRLAYSIAPTLTALFAEVRVGHPVLVLQNLGLRWYPRWHFAVVKGFDLSRRKVVLNSGTLENYEISLATFERTWARAEHWGMLALAPGAMPATAAADTYFIALAALEETRTETMLVSAYESGLRAWPTDPNLLMGYGNLLYSRGLPDLAAEQYAQLIALDAGYAPAWNNLAQIFFEQGAAQQALVHAQQAVALGGPFIATYRATLLKISASLR